MHSVWCAPLGAPEKFAISVYDRCVALLALILVSAFSGAKTTIGSWILQAIHPLPTPMTSVLSTGVLYLVYAIDPPSVCVLVLVRVQMTVLVRLTKIRHVEHVTTTAHSMPPLCTQMGRGSCCSTGVPYKFAMCVYTCTGTSTSVTSNTVSTSSTPPNTPHMRQPYMILCVVLALVLIPMLVSISISRLAQGSCKPSFPMSVLLSSRVGDPIGPLQYDSFHNDKYNMPRLRYSYTRTSANFNTNTTAGPTVDPTSASTSPATTMKTA